jgi:hypothetical protein
MGKGHSRFAGAQLKIEKLSGHITDGRAANSPDRRSEGGFQGVTGGELLLEIRQEGHYLFNSMTRN